MTMSAPKRGSCLLALLLGLGLLTGSAGFPSRAVSSGSSTFEIALRDLLHTGLKSRLPREKGFVEHVVQLVEKRQLPLDLVMSTFLWARQQQPYPFPYFERALRLRAAQRGIAI
jgi:hypothetical protein